MNTNDMQHLNGFNKTIGYYDYMNMTSNYIVTIFDWDKEPRSIALDIFGKDIIYFGRGPENDIILTSKLVSYQHGRFVRKNNKWIIEDKRAYSKEGSTNGLIHNNSFIYSSLISDGDIVRIDNCQEAIPNGVLFTFSSKHSNKWMSVPINRMNTITIGRSENCSIVLPHVTVSKVHAAITFENGCHYLTDNNSTNGVIINNKQITGKVKLHEKDVILITNSKLIYTANAIFYCCYNSGVSVEASNILITRKKGNSRVITTNNVSMSINPGELVAIIGGSGAGKSTILNCMCVYLEPDKGTVLINGVDLYQNFDSLKSIVGYVPQSDIVYDNLTLYDMLLYTAKLRLPEDTTENEREAAIKRAIDLVELQDETGNFIKRLSGGQRKRASIAVELLSDPNLLFLDEPSSGLDPGTERSLMLSLRKMSNSGKTIALVTHSTLQLQMCDRIAFMGKGGNLCFLGSYDEALKFFNVHDIVDVYNLITENADYWRDKFENTKRTSVTQRQTGEAPRAGKENRLKQAAVLSSRYFKLVANDKQRLLLLLLQAPLLAFLISLVADGNEYQQYEMTKSLLFALSCSAFWIGMLNAIQEVCKERTILKREYMTGLSLSSYIISKIAVLGLLCLLQSFILTVGFSVLIGLPEEGLLLHPFFEILITAFITAFSATAMGLFVSSLFTNADRAMTVAPILLMPQILFSGLIFKLGDSTEIISWFATCRWSMEGLGTTANLNDLPLKLQQEGILVPHEVESFFDYSVSHLGKSWIMLLVFSVVFLVLARIMLGKIGKEKS